VLLVNSWKRVVPRHDSHDSIVSAPEDVGAPEDIGMQLGCDVMSRVRCAQAALTLQPLRSHGTKLRSVHSGMLLIRFFYIA
jgi:hypothetical protein